MEFIWHVWSSSQVQIVDKLKVFSLWRLLNQENKTKVRSLTNLLFQEGQHKVTNSIFALKIVNLCILTRLNADRKIEMNTNILYWHNFLGFSLIKNVSFVSNFFLWNMIFYAVQGHFFETFGVTIQMEVKFWRGSLG